MRGRIASAGYVVLGLPLGILELTLLVVDVSLVPVLAFFVIGIPLAVALLAKWRELARFERWLAGRLLGVAIPEPPPVSQEGGLRARFAELRSPVLWRALGFGFLRLPVGTAGFAVVGGLALLGLSLLFAPLIVAFVPLTLAGREIGTEPQAVAMMPLGLVSLGLALLAAPPIGRWQGALARALLGPSARELEEQARQARAARTRILEAADAERRRIERDLHDGAQQRLYALRTMIGAAEAQLDRDPAAARELMGRVRGEAAEALAELRELTRGIHPATLTNLGLPAALEALAGRAPVPVALRGVPGERLPEPLEAAVYFTVSEALVNVAKHAGATRVEVELRVGDDAVVVEVRDDGRGGADAAGSGLRGLADRAAALDGHLEVESPPGGGTTLRATLPRRPGDGHGDDA